MKRRLLTTVWLVLLTSVFAITAMAQGYTVQVNSEGGLWDALEAQGVKDFSSVKRLKITGVMGDIDFKLIKNQMSKLESIDISEVNVKVIPSGTFSDKESLVSVRLPEGVTSISSSLFSNCQLLGSVTFGSQTAVTGKIVFPASLRYIDSDAFNSCYSLTDLDFSACTSLERLGYSVFNNCRKITHLDFSACTSLNSIDGYALASLYNLKEVILPSQGNLSLSYYCFEVYSYWDETTQQEVSTGLESLTLTKAVTYLGNNCLPRTLKTLYVESSTPPSCDGSAFNSITGYATSLKVYVPNGSKRNYAVADGWSNIYQKMTELGFKVSITGYGMVQKGSSNYGNGDVLFASQSGATTLKAVPEVGCTLISVKLNSTAVSVATDGTFTIPAGSTIGTLDVAFTANPFTVANPNGGELKNNISNPASLRALKVTGKMASKDWTFIKNNLPQLEMLDLSETDIQEIPESALQNKERLTTVHLPSSVTKINGSAFYYCPMLAIVDGCENVKEIGNDAFSNCNQLSQFPFGNGLKSIGWNVFDNCTSLPETLVMPSSLNTLGGSIFDGSSVRTFDLSQCALTGPIDDNVFGKCTSLLLPENGDYYLSCSALRDAQLTELRLPSVVSGINCGNALPTMLERLYVSRVAPFTWLANDAFNNLDFDRCTLYVPVGAAEAYSEASGWLNFTKIQEQGFKVNISGYGSVQLGGSSYGSGDVLFANPSGATTLKAVPEEGCKLVSVKLNGTAVSTTDGTFTIPAGSTIGTIDVEFTATPFTIDNPDGGTLKDQIVAMGRTPNSIRVLKVTGKMATKDWNYVKSNLTMLRELDITQTDVKNLPEQVLQEHQNISAVHLPSTVTIIGNSAFYNCPQLTIVDGCEQVKEIGSSSFAYCKRLSVFPFGNAIQKIESDAFYGCSSLPATLVMPASFTYLGWGNVFNESSVRSFDLSQCTLTGGFAYNTFGKCTSLLLPEKGDYQMAYSALREAQLTELRLPGALSYIYGDNVLPTTLERLYVSRTTPFEVSDNGSFRNIDFDNCTLYVPIGSVDAYAEAARWSDFTKVKEYGMQVIVAEQGKLRSSGQTLMGTSLFFPTSDAATFEIQPNAGWHTESVTLNNTAIAFANNKFTLSGDQLNGKLAVTFAINQFNLQLQIAGSGKVKLGSLEYTANQVLTVDSLAKLNFTLEPAAGQVVSAITFNGKESVVQNGGTNYVTPAITANSTLAITFGASGSTGNTATYTVNIGENGTVEYLNTSLLPQTTIQVKKGVDAVFTIKPDDYYVIEKVLLDGTNVTDQVDANGQLTVKNVNADGTLQVTFIMNPHVIIALEEGMRLDNALTDAQKQSVTKLTVTGQLREEDYYTMRDKMPQLAEIDLYGATSDWVPSQAFCVTQSWESSVGKKTLTNVRLPEGTRNIGWFAFAGCSNLKEVNFTELKNLEGMDTYAFAWTALSVVDLSQTKLTSVGDQFYKVKGLENVKLPKDLNYLGYMFRESSIVEVDLSNCTSLKTLDGTFQDSKKLEKVTLPEGLVSISYAFSGCEALTTINLPKSLQSIGGNTFSNTKLQTVDLSGCTELVSIGSSAFNGCNELKDVILPASLQSLGNSAFSNSSITTIDLSKTQLQEISEYTFYYCRQLESVKLPKDLRTIGNRAFYGCNKLAGLIELPATIVSIGEYAFWETKIAVVKSNAITPPTISNYSMSDKWETAFVPEGCLEAYRTAPVWEDKVILDKEVFAEVTVTREGNLAIDINEQAGISPALVTHLKVHGPLGVQDFAIMRSNMTVLYDLDMEDAEVSVIPENALLDKKVLMNVKLPASLLRIEHDAFRGCSSLKGSLALPNGLQFIGWAAFQGCNSLEEVVLNQNLEVIQGYAFEGCSSLTQEITLPRDFSSLGEHAFANCSSLYGTVKFNRDFYMFMGTENYGSSTGYCFENCSKIETVDMSEPDFLDEIPYGTFSGCTSLKTVLLPPMLDRIDNNAFSNCTSLVNIEFPSSLLVINYSAFQNCTSLRSVNLSDCKEFGTIESYAFYGCSNLEAVYLPKSLNWINGYAFAECRKLANLTVEALQPADLGDYVFRHVHTERCVLSIPTGTFYDYLSAAQWGEFVSMRKNIDVTVGEGANLYFLSSESVASARASRRAGETGQQGAKVKDGSSLYVQENETAIFQVNPDENVQITKVLFNGKDVTSQMVNGTYETPGVTDASSFEVQVKVVGDIHVKELRMLDDEVAVKMGENRQLRFAVYPTNATNKSIQWTSSNNDIATVNSEGIITGRAPGRAEITAKTVDGDFEQKCQIVIMSNNYWIVMDNTVNDFVENSITLPLALHNEGEARDIQFDVYMPEGVSMNSYWNGDFGIERSSRAYKHRVSAARLSDGAVRVIVYSIDGDQFENSDGELLTLPFTTGSEVGSFDVTIKNIHISGPNNFDFAAPNHTIHFNLKDYPMGDSNGSGDVTINDAVFTVDYILQQCYNRFIMKAADVNKDDQITVADVTATVDIILERPLSNRAQSSRSGDAQGRLYMNNMSVTPGEQQTVGLQIENAADFIAFQCDITLPDGMNVARDENNNLMVSLANGVTSSHVTTANILDSGVLRVVVISPENEHFSLFDTNVVNLTVTTDDALVDGSVVDIRNIRLVRDDNSEYLAPDASVSVLFNDPTAIEKMQMAQGMKTRTEGHYLIVDSSSATNLQMVSTDGVSRHLKVREGENRFFIENAGVYIINGKKLFVK